MPVRFHLSAAVMWLVPILLGIGLAWGVIDSARAGVQPISPLQVDPPSPSEARHLAEKQGLKSVVESQDGITLEWELPTFTIENTTAAGQPCQVIHISGYDDAAMPGEMRIPSAGIMLGVPPAAQISLNTDDTTPVVLAGSYRLCPQAQPVMEINPAGETIYRDARAYWDASVAINNRFLPLHVVELVDIAYMRSQRVALVHLHPFQFNPATGELHYYPRLRVSIGFETIDPDITPGTRSLPGSDQLPGIVDEGAFEDTLKATLVNYESARVWRVSPSKSLWVQPDELDQPSYKVLVQEDGIYQVTYADLLAAGLPVDSIDPRTFHLANRGAEVAIYVSGESDRTFDNTDYLLFYGQSAGARYTDVNVYWLTWGGEDGLRMSTVSGAPGGASVPAYFPARQHIERNERYVPSYPSGPDLDRWYWTYIMAVTPQTYTYTFGLHNLYTSTPMSATVRGLLRGYAANPRHHTQFYLNGHLLMDGFWYGDAEYLFEVQAPQAYLREGENKLVVKAPMGSGITYDYFLVNWFEVDYWDTFIAEGDRLDFEALTNGEWEYRVSGFTTNVVEVYDISAPQSPQMVIDGVVETDAGGYHIRFQQTIDQPRRFLALNRERWKKPLSITLDAPSNLHSTANAADYLLIAYDGFYDQALPLATFRQGQGLRVQAVKLQDVYDEFSHGLVDPHAIHDFLAYAYANWVRPAPLYVLLVGDGNYDFKNYLGTGEVSYVPPYLADVDPWMGETANENYYVSVSGADILPDMHLGRLPVKTPAETTALVNKIIAYEQGTVVGDWNKNVLFVADDADSAGDFASLSDAIADGYLPAPYTAQKLYYGIHQTTPAAMKTAILQGMNQGALLVNYIGHAGRQWWAAEQFFTYTDVNSLSNAGHLPLMVPMTCLDGYFINPSAVGQDRSSLAESLVRPAGKGAIASWSPTGLGVAAGHDYLNRGLYQAFFRDYVTEIGAAATQAKYHLYTSTVNFRDLIQTYALIGDPVTRLAVLRPELNLKKAATSPSVLQPGGFVTYTLVFSNSGLVPATQVVISDILPSGLLNPAVSFAGVSITPRPGTRFVWDLSALLPGASGSINITGQFEASTSGHIVNTAWMNSFGALEPVTDTAAVDLYWLYYLPIIAR